MRFATFAGEKTISDLIKTHYGALSAAEAKRAEKLIVDANPQLKSLADVPAGAVLRLPPVTAKKAKPPSGEDAAVQAEAYNELFDRFAEELKAAIEEETRTLKEDERIGADVKKAVDQTPDAGKLLEEVRRGLKDRAARLTEARELLDELPAIQSAVEELLKQ